MNTVFKTIALTTVLITLAQEVITQPHSIARRPPSPLIIRPIAARIEGREYPDEELNSPLQVQDSAPQTPVADVDEMEAPEIPVEPESEEDRQLAEFYPWIDNLNEIVACNLQLERHEDWMDKLPEGFDALEISQKFFELYLELDGLFKVKDAPAHFNRIYVNACKVHIYKNLIHLSESASTTEAHMIQIAECEAALDVLTRLNNKANREIAKARERLIATGKELFI